MKIIRVTLTLAGAAALATGLAGAAQATPAEPPPAGPATDAAPPVWLLDGVRAPLDEHGLALDGELLAPLVNTLAAATD